MIGISRSQSSIAGHTTGRFARAHRFGEVVRALSVFVFLWTIPAARRAPLSVTARSLLERLGGAWIKLGQALALRFDLLPEDFCLEFFKLLNQVRPFATAEVIATIEAELQQPLARLFATFEEEPFAAASIGQVHRATLEDGQRVAVKVQRPGIANTFALDIALMQFAARWIDRVAAFGAANAASVVQEFARWTALELDYTIEARHGTELRTNAGGDPTEQNAAVHWSRTTRRVLTTDLIDGILLMDIVTALRRGDDAYLRTLRAAGYRLDRIARAIDWNLFNQTYVHGQFHADLHPANLFVLPGNRIGYVDFGIVGRFSPELRRSMIRYSQRFFDGDADGATSELLRWMTPTGATDAERARADMVLVHEAFSFQARSGRGGAGDDVYAFEVMRVVREHSLRLAPEIVAYLKVLATAESLRGQLAPDYDLRTAVLRFLRRAVIDDVYRAVHPRELVTGGYHLLQRVNDSLSFLEDQRGTGTLLLDTLTNVQRQADGLRRRLLWLGLGAMAGLAALGAMLMSSFHVAAVPDLLRPRGPVAAAVGLAVFLVLIVMLSQRRHLSALRRDAQNAQAALSVRWSSSGAR